MYGLWCRFTYKERGDAENAGVENAGTAASMESQWFSYKPCLPSLWPIVRLLSLPRLCGFLFRSTFFQSGGWRNLSFKWIKSCVQRDLEKWTVIGPSYGGFPVLFCLVNQKVSCVEKVHDLQPTSRPPKSLPSSNKQSPRRCVQCSEVTCLYLDVGSTTAESPLSNVGLYVKWVPTDAPKDVEKVQAVVRCFMSLPPACWKHFTRFCLQSSGPY